MEFYNISMKILHTVKKDLKRSFDNANFFTT